MKANLRQGSIGEYPATAVSRVPVGRGGIWLDSSLRLGTWGARSLRAEHPVEELILDDNHSVFFERLTHLTRDQGLTAVGFISYEAALHWLGVRPRYRHTGMPLGHFFVYDRVEWQESSEPICADAFPMDTLPAVATDETVPQHRYLKGVRAIKEHIRAGDIYQANLTCRFNCRSSLPPEQAYLRLRQLNPAPYSAYLDFGDYQVLSSSPERMMHVANNRICSTPIKGTAPLGRTPEETQRHRERLLASVKDRAELLMIVDLVRNDLGRIARTGSVRVDELFRAQEYSSLIHLMSDICADLLPNATLEDVFSALLPGGSITGAPKKRAVEIINEIEDTPRSVYTGSIGYIDRDTIDFNIAIRTMIHSSGTYYVYAGGGIVADSDPEAEYREMLLKARNLFRCLGISL